MQFGINFQSHTTWTRLDIKDFDFRRGYDCMDAGGTISRAEEVSMAIPLFESIKS